MKTSDRHSTRVRLEMAVIAFFVLTALSLFVVYLADPSIYAQTLALTPTPVERYPAPVTLFLIGILALIALLIIGVVRHWRWVFWLMLVAFGASALQVPATILQITGVLPDTNPLWYSLYRMGIAVIEVALAVWMIRIYRAQGVWAMGSRGSGR